MARATRQTPRRRHRRGRRAARRVVRRLTPSLESAEYAAPVVEAGETGPHPVAAVYESVVARAASPAVTLVDAGAEPRGLIAVRAADGVHFCPPGFAGGRGCPMYASGARRFGEAMAVAALAAVPALPDHAPRTLTTMSGSHGHPLRT